MIKTQSTIIAELSETLGIPKSKCKEFTQAFLGKIAWELKSGDTVQLIGFGKFYPIRTKERMRINPHTKTTFKCPSKTAFKCKLSKSL